MSKAQFIFVVFVTTLILLVGLAIANRYYTETNQYSTGSDQTVEQTPPLEPTLQPEPIPRTIEGKIVAITDGDTVKVLAAEKRLYIIRLAGIDAPEHAQDFGNKSKEYLSSLIFDQAVQINATKIDKYGRTLGQIYIGEKDINLEIIKAGLAWHYKKYEVEQTEKDRKLYADAEILARKKKVGLWSMPNPTPPWIFRHPELNQN